VEDAWFGEPVVGELPDPCPGHSVLLATPPKRAPPVVDDVVTKGRECPAIGRHCVVLEEAGDHPLAPFRLFADFRGSITHPTQSLCPLRRSRRRIQRNTRYQADATPYLGRSFTCWITSASPDAPTVYSKPPLRRSTRYANERRHRVNRYRPPS
jgi:hypothetical protein